MKILQLFDFFSLPHGGGSVDILYRLSQTLAQRGHQTTIYTSDFELDQEYINSLQGVKVYPFHSWLNMLGMHVVPGLVTEVKRTLKEFDIVHLHQYRSSQNIIIRHYAKKYGIPYVIDAHGSAPRTTGDGKGIKWLLKWLFDMVFGSRILRDASRLIATQPTEIEQYRELGVEESKIVEIPNSIDIDEYKQLPEKGTFRKKYGITEEYVVLYLGRIHKIKGLDILVPAVAELIDEGESIRLVIIGPDDGYLSALRDMLEELKIEERVIVTGFIAAEMKLAAYVDADVYVLPSIYESFSNTVLEAGACGTPVIITDRCQIAPLVKDTLGLVVPYDKDQLRDALLHILTDGEMRTRFGETGRALVREKYTWSHSIKQIETVYEEVVAGNHG